MRTPWLALLFVLALAGTCESKSARREILSAPQSAPRVVQVVSPEGIRGKSLLDYDATSGGLDATIDADGHRIAFEHAIDARVERITDRNGQVSVMQYDDAGRVLRQTNALGETIARSYDGEGNVLTETDPLQRTTTRTYDARGNLATDTNAAGETTTSTYNVKNQVLTQTDAAQRPVLSNAYDVRSHQLLTSMTDALNQVTSFGYVGGTGAFGSGQLEAITDPSGASTRFGYDARGYKNRDTDALNHSVTTVNDAHGRVRSQSTTRTVTAADGSTHTETLTTTYTRDAKGRVTATTHADGSRTTAEYAGLDRPSRECDALNRCTTHVYNARGEAIETIFHDGAREAKAYDPNGNRIAQTDRNGQTTTFVYDAANRLTQTIHPDADADDGDPSNNPRSTNRYDRAGQLIESIDEQGRTTTYEYDAAGRRTRVIAPDPETAVTAAGPVSQTHYDASGRREASTDPNGRRITYVLDLVGRVVETVYPDDTLSDDSDNPRSRVEYDSVGRKTAVIDEQGRITRYAYDKLGRLVATVLPNPVTQANPPLVNGESPDAGTLTTRYRYDEVGNKIEQRDADGRITRWEYDSMGRETARVLPEGQRETKRYNVAGEVIAFVDFKGETTTYEYDLGGRLERVVYPHDAAVSFGYLPSGERNRVTDARGTSTMQFDRRARLVQSRDADGGLIEYQYDEAGNLLARISSSQSLVFTHDALNRIKTVTRSVDGEAPAVTRYEYDAAGNRTAMLGSDGIRTEYSYDPRNRLRELVKKTATGALLLAMQYTVDASGLRTAVEESDTTGPVRAVAYEYDAVKRLTQETIDHRDAAKDRATAWTYDRVGNRLTQTLTTGGTTETTTYTYDRNDRLLSEVRSGGGASGTTTYTYDANGNTLTKTGPSAATTYRYNDANRLIEAITPQGVTSYVYNADGLRARQTHTPSGGTPTTTWYVQDTVNPYAEVIEEHTSQGSGPKSLSATFTFSGDEIVSQTRYSGGTPVTRFVHADGFGSTRWLTDRTGAITDTIDYSAFGEEIGRTGTTAIEHLYRGERFDANVGFYDLRARLYSPESGRFTQQDTWLGRKKKPASLNKYVYAESDPVTFSDPSGHFLASGGLGAAPTVAAIQATAAVAAQSALRVFATRALVALGTAAITVTAGTLATQVERSPLADPRALADARVLLQKRVDTEAQRRRKDDVFYHYTDRTAALEIYSYGVMWTTAPYDGRLGNGIYKPAGAYATDIQPWNPLHTQAQLSAMFYGGNTNRDVSWFVAVDAEGFVPVFSTPHEFVKYGPYPGEVDVDPVYFGPSLISR